MLEKVRATLKEASPYNGVLSREQFLFFETRTVAQLMSEGLDKTEIVDRIVRENLFQYPTEKSVAQMARTCIYRLEALEDVGLIEAIATQPSAVTKQICLYAMMRRYRLVWDFMITVIGEKYKTLDMTLRKSDINGFFSRLQEQDDWVATWSESTVNRIKQVLRRTLVETEYLDDVQSELLNPVLISTILESAIRKQGLDIALPAFNCLT